MRVIAGTARSLPLKTVPGDAVRPTTDRIKETLFNMIRNEVPGSRFLDLFAGSGGIGIEALSRGAEQVVFVDNSRASIQCIQDNLRFTKLSEAAEVIKADATEAITRLSVSKKPFDVIFMDPPYDRSLEKEVLKKLSASTLVGEDTLIIVEASLATDVSYLSDYGFTITKDKKYKSNRHLFIRSIHGGNV